jgi:hypothetical protein
VVARLADDAGVDRIGVDLERLGKAGRQDGLGTWISPHTEEDLAELRLAVSRGQLFARLNPLHGGTAREADAVLGYGAEVLMLPMVSGPEEIERFVDLVEERALVVPLLERGEALSQLDAILAVDGIDEIHVGLNDLALTLGLPNRWLALASDLMVSVGQRVAAAGFRFGLGGIGRAGDRDLPIPSDLVYAEYARTGATAALLARSFTRPDTSSETFSRDVAEARSRLEQWRRADTTSLEAAHQELIERATALPSW